jgi:hypothetical protein
VKHLSALLITGFFVAGCAEQEPMTVANFLENEAALFGTLARCEDNRSAGTDPECRNARQAAERISLIEERAMRKAREEAFASAREEYRVKLDRERGLRVKAEAAAEEARLMSLVMPPVKAPEEFEVEPLEGVGPAPAALEVAPASDQAAAAAEPAGGSPD